MTLTSVKRFRVYICHSRKVVVCESSLEFTTYLWGRAVVKGINGRVRPRKKKPDHVELSRTPLCPGAPGIPDTACSPGTARPQASGTPPVRDTTCARGHGVPGTPLPHQGHARVPEGPAHQRFRLRHEANPLKKCI